MIQPEIPSKMAKKNLPSFIHEALDKHGIFVQEFAGWGSREPELHMHEFVELVYVRRGKLWHLTEDRYSEDSTGTLSVIHFNQAHGLYTPHEPVDLLNIYLNPDRLALPRLPAEVAGLLPFFLPLHPALGYEQNRLSRVVLPDPVLADALMKGMLREQEHHASGWRAALSGYFELLLIECCRVVQQGGVTAPSTLSAVQQRMEKVRGYIDAHFSEPLPLDRLGEMAGMKKPYLCRCFREHTGKTVLEYINGRRLEQAMMLLRTTDRKVIDVSAECGFGDLSGFNRTFRKMIGTTPSAYRRR